MHAEAVDEAGGDRGEVLRGVPGLAAGGTAAAAWMAENPTWLAKHSARMLAELAAELELVLATSSDAAPLDVVGQAHAMGWPIEVSAFWITACRRRGSTWAEIGAAMGMSHQAARRRYGPWEQRFGPVPRAGGAGRAGRTGRAGRAGGAHGDATNGDAASAFGGNIPMAITSFIGRQRDRAELGRLLEAHRLVTLTGPPGVGKTRLALELARALSLTREAWLVELADVREPTGVLSTVAELLGVVVGAGDVAGDSLIEHLSGRDVLLVLDNGEHLLDACARFVRRVLETCPGVTIVATSQERLGVGGERVWPVTGLTVPAAGTGGAGIGTTDAVMLFCERAAAVRPDFSLTPDVILAVSRICKDLDGNPLAIELAATRAAELAPAELARLVQDPFDLLVGGSPAEPARHRSLRAAFDWSHGLLTGPQQVLLRRLTVFAGCPTRAGTEHVCGGDMGGDSAAPPVTDLLSGLVAKSLVVADSDGPETRYRLSATVRRYGNDRLRAAGEEIALRRRHTQWCVELAERAEPELTGPEQRKWLSRLDEDHADLLAALAWATGPGGDGRSALRMAGALTLYWRVRGSFTQGRGWLGAALAAALDTSPNGSADEHGRQRAKALWGAGFLAVMVSDFDTAQRLLGEGLAVYRELDHASGCARSLLLLGNVSQHWADAGDIPASLLAESAQLARQAGDAWCFAHALALLGRTRADQGDATAARALLVESIEVARRSGDAQSLRIGLNVLGNLAMSQGAYDEAEALLGEDLAVTQDLGEEHGVAAALKSLGELAAARGDFVRARTLLHEALDRARRSVDPQTVTGVLCALGDLNAAKGDPEVAKGQFSEAAERARRLGMTSASASLGLARAALAVGQSATALPLLYQVLAAARGRGDKLLEGDALDELGVLSRADGDLRRAATLHRQALVLRRAAGDLPAVAESLEELAGVAVVLGSLEHAARVFGAAQGMRDLHHFVRLPDRQAGNDHDVAELRARLAPGPLEAAWAHGMTMTVEDAVRCACAGRGGSRALGGWASLTPSERKVATLASEGLSNQEIATQLYLSRHTVAAHLTAAYPKLGIRSRKELGAAVAAAET